MVASGATLVVGPAEGVSAGRFAVGLSAAALLLGVAPTLLYALLGYWLGARRGWLVGACVISVAPYLLYIFLAVVLVAERTTCSPGDYGCPLYI